MKRRSFLAVAPVAAIATWLPHRAFSATASICAQAIRVEAVESRKIRILGARSFGHDVIKRLRNSGVAADKCLYGAAVSRNTELGSRLLVVYSERDVLSWPERAREIQTANVLIGVGSLGDEDRSGASALEELAHLAKKAEVCSPIAVVCLPVDGRRSPYRQPTLERLRAVEQLQDIRKTFPTVILVDVSRQLEGCNRDVALNAPNLMVDHTSACVTALLSMVRVAQDSRDTWLWDGNELKPKNGVSSSNT